jgi:hypothetical protein
VIDVAGTLAAHEKITVEELATLRQLAGWLHQVRVAFQLPAASPRGLWVAILSGGGLARGAAVDQRSGGDAALFRLAELHRHFAELHQLDRLGLIMRIAAGESWPANAHALDELRSGLQIVINLQRRGRHRAPEASPAVSVE